MDNNQKYSLSMLFLCIVSSVLASLIMVNIFYEPIIIKEVEVVYIEHISGPININNALKSELMTLPGIGETLADRIIEGRPYKYKEELLNIFGIGESIYKGIEDKVEV